MYSKVKGIGVVLLVACSFSWSQDIRLSAHGNLKMSAEEPVTALSFSGDGTLLLSADKSGNIECWNLDKRASIASARVDDEIIFVAFLTGDRMYVVVDRHGNVRVFDLLKGATGTSFESKGKPTRIALDAGKQYLAIANSDEHIEMYDLKALIPSGSINAEGKLEDVLFLGFDRLGQQLVAVMQLGDVNTWNPVTMKLLRSMALAGGELHGSQAVVHAAATNRAANIFAVSLEEVAIPKGGIANARDLERRDMVIAYDWASGTEVKRVKTQWLVEQMALGPGNDHVAVTNDEDKSVTLIDLRKGEVGSAVSLESKPKVLCVSEDNKWLAAGATDGVVAVWSMQYKGEATAASSTLPSLSGRIRTRSGTQPALKPGEQVKMAIIGFEAKGVAPEIADVCVSSLSNTLANFDYITLVERRQIESIVKEQQFQLSGLTEEQGVAVGKISSADVILLGNVGKLGTSLIFSARLISVETGKVLKGREVICEECRDQDIYDAISTLASTIAQ